MESGNGIPKAPIKDSDSDSDSVHKMRNGVVSGWSRSRSVPTETVDAWDQMFLQQHHNNQDIYITTPTSSSSSLNPHSNINIIPAHSSILRLASPVLANSCNNATTCIPIPGAPYEAVRVFIRFLYSSRYEEEDMNKFALHLLLFSHSYSVPSLKRLCIHFLEHRWLTNDNVVDVLQLARKCDAPRLSLICVRIIVNNFKAISSTQGWKVMRQADPALEQELIESVVEADSMVHRKQERLRKMEEKKVYVELNQAMEALDHICEDGCGTIGPSDKDLKGSQVSCSFPGCKGVEALVRHFSDCKMRVPGGCVHCKRMWQLLELHSRMCNRPYSCKVPLCRHFKDKIQQQSKREETKWNMLVGKVIASNNSVAAGAFPALGRGSAFL